MFNLKPKLAQILLLDKRITMEQLQEALLKQKQKKQPLGKILIDLGYVNEDDVTWAYAKQIDVPYVSSDEIKSVPQEVRKIIPTDYAIKNRIIPLGGKDSILYIATAKLNDIVVEDLKHITKFTKIVQKLTTEANIANYYKSYSSDAFNTLIDKVTVEAEKKAKDYNLEVIEDNANLESITAADAAPAIKVVNEILNRAIEQKASDIHIEPYDKGMFLRYRIYGVLYDQPSLPKTLQNSVISRVKIMAKLNIAERRLPQDGRIRIKMRDKEIDLRISLVPTVFGEKIVMRILDSSSLCVDLNNLGIEPKFFKIFKDKINAPYGMVLVTGPTGSGKTTTLYSALTELNQRDVNIVTAEDPVEYMLKGVNQVQVFSDIGLTFPNLLRTFLRQDPDIIMVGEIRDTETAEIAINAALTGHLVLSTLHTNDAIGVITRLINMDIEPYLISSVLILAIAQRLVRRLCSKCRQKEEWKKTDLINLGIDADVLKDCDETVILYKPKGCSDCRDTGFTGRMGCFEVLNITNEIKEYILQRSSAEDIKKVALKSGDLITLRKDASMRMLVGQTSLDEVLGNTARD